MVRTTVVWAIVALVLLFAGGCAARITPLVTDSADAIRLPTPTPDPDTGAAAEAPAGSTEKADASLPPLRNWGQAPELANDVWLNSAPLRLADLRGKVVMIDFWTFGCINCQHVTPALQKWHAEYADDGLVIVGVHTPEFGYEEDVANVKAAAERMGVVWPVAIDNDKATWRAYNNAYWPAMYLVNKRGDIRYLAIGEGQYEQTEAVIQALLADVE